MISSGNDKDSQKPKRDATSSSVQYLPDYIRTRTKHRKAPHLGTFNVGLEVPQRTPDHVPGARYPYRQIHFWHGYRHNFGYRHPLINLS